MYKDKLREREHGDEEQYFRRHDEELIRKLRERAHLHEVADLLAQKLEVDDPALLRRIKDLGVTLETAPAFLLAPLVQIAWAEGRVTGRERQVILDIARARGIKQGTPPHECLLSWLSVRPPAELFEASLQAIHAAITVLPELERAERVRTMAALGRRVAGTSGGLARLLGLADGIGNEEQRILEAIEAALQG